MATKKSSAVPFAMEVAGPDPQGAVLRRRASSRWRPSSCGRGCGRWPAASRRSRSRGDYVAYEILDQSVIVVRGDDMERAGVPQRLPAPRRTPRRGSGHLRERVHLPVPRLVLRRRRREHLRLAVEHVHAEHNIAGGRDRPGPGAVRDLGRLRLDQPRRRRRRRCASASSRSRRTWTPGSSRTMHAEWWCSFRLPVNWKLAQEAFMEQYHVLETHPQLRTARPLPAARTSRSTREKFLASELAVPAGDERRHGRHGARQRRQDRRAADAEGQASGRSGGGARDVGARSSTTRS